MLRFKISTQANLYGIYGILTYLLLIRKIPQSEGQTCPDGFRSSMEQCYLLTEEPVDFASAEVICADKYDAMLMTVHSETEQLILQKFRASVDPPIPSVWLYLSDKDFEGRFQWLDGSELDYENWEDSDNRDGTLAGDSLDCVVALGEGMLWLEVSCFDFHHVICKREPIAEGKRSRLEAAGEMTKEKTDDSNEDQSNASEHDTKKDKLFSKEDFHTKKDRGHSKEDGGTKDRKAHSKEVDDTKANESHSTEDDDTEKGRAHSKGDDRTKKGKAHSREGEDQSKEGQEYSNEESDVVKESKETSNDDDDLRVEEDDVGPPLRGGRSKRQSQSEEKWSESCTAGVILQASQMCVWMTTSQKQFHQAEKQCQKYGGIIFRPASQSLVNDIKLAMASEKKSNGIKSYWIGLEKDGSTYLWQDGVTPSWENWAAAMKFDGKGDDCVIADVDDDHRWTDENCHKKHAYICQFATVSVDGNWSGWGAWTGCSVTCGTGKQVRERTCSDPAPSGDGLECSGDQSEIQLCSPVDCKADGNWSGWEAWSGCSVTCGTGNQVRERKCANPAPSGGGQECQGDNSETQLCSSVDCKVDGSWSIWEAWSVCSVTCGSGNQVRQRKCANPAPSGGGLECQGDNSETQLCSSADCKVDGNWSGWEAWSGCSVTCGTGNQVRERKCANPAPSGGGQECQGDNSETQLCSSVDCKVDGSWSIWEAWSVCSVTCGSGNQVRQRKCANPAPSGGGLECQGYNSDSQLCSSADCKVDGSWSVWEAWSGCSVTCGSGNQVRERKCANPAPSGGGLECQGDNSETQLCSFDDCRDGSWSDWEAWSGCSVTCGSGIQVRERKCANPAPSGGGLECQGDNSETQLCSSGDCRVDGNWSGWGAWSMCSATCGTGSQARERKCANPFPSGGGLECQGDNSEIRLCSIAECTDQPGLKEMLFEIAAEGFGLYGCELVRTKKTSLVQCALNCVHTTRCKSFNFEYGWSAEMSRNHTCILNFANRFEEPDDYLPMPGYQLYSIGPKL